MSLLVFLVGQTIVFCGLPPESIFDSEGQAGAWQTTKSDGLPHQFPTPVPLQ
jgi:hypothetical protein